MAKFYITTPIYYVNDEPHIGSAYTTLAADVISRWHKQKGDKVFFLTGTDEHGRKIQQIARKNQVLPQAWVDKVAKGFKKAWLSLGIEYDYFIQTTNESHIRIVQKTTQQLFERGYIYKGSYEGLYCVGCEQFKRKSDLINGLCPEHKIKPEIYKEEAYLFKTSQFQDILTEKIKNDEFKIAPQERKNEVLSFLKQKLEDVAISRPKKEVSWGIELPFDKNHTLYVWIDAFLNYLTGLGWDGEAKLKDKAKEFFPPDLQLMSKDILRVHATIWPSLLLALGLPLPKEIFVHGYFTVEGQKISKSLGNVIYPAKLVDDFGQNGARYLLMTSIPYAADSDFSLTKAREKYNADLANGIGNLISRVAAMVNNYLNGKLPKIEPEEKIKIALEKFKKEVNDLMNEYKLFETLQVIILFSNSIDKYLNEAKPWELYNKKDEFYKRILVGATKSIEKIAEFLKAFMPETFSDFKIEGKINQAALFPRHEP